MPTTTDISRARVRTVLGTLAALAIVAVGGMVVTAQPARASDLAGITDGTYLLHTNGDPGCSAQAVRTDDGILFLTANHCVESKTAAYSVNRVTFDDVEFDKKVVETAYYVDVVKRDATSEIAVLRLIDRDQVLDAVDLATVEEAKEALTKGTGVLVAGFPGSQNSPIGDLVFTEGMYTGLSRSFVPTVKAPMYRTTASIYYGNSGGGLYVEIDNTWKLVGVTSQTDPEMRWSNSLFVTRDAIEKAIRLTPKPATDK